MAKKNKNAVVIDMKDQAVLESSTVIADGVPSLHDLMAPAGIDRSDPNKLIVGNKHVRSFMISGYPQQIAVGWANNLFDYNGDLDVVLHVFPMDDRAGQNELTAKITQFQAQLSTELEKGDNRNITLLQSKIQALVNERAEAENNRVSLFSIQMLMNLYCNTESELNKGSQLLEASMRGQKTKLESLNLRQDDGYKTALPFGQSWLPRTRNMSSSGLVACFPFYNASISHPSGVMLGVNNQTKTPIYIDFFDRKLLDSGNTTVFGSSGSGKSFFVSLLTMRSALKGIRTAIIDPEAEYTKITEALGGVNVEIRPGGAIPNPFDLQEEDILDNNDVPTGKKIVKVNEKIMDILNLLGLMCKELDREQSSLLSIVLAKTYEDFGISEDPDSLYIKDITVGARGELIHHGQRKEMPTISDFYERLVESSKKPGNESIIKIANTMKMYTKTGVFGMFDTQTPPSLANLKDSPVVNFDISFLSDETLRPIGMYIALSWCADKFIKQDLSIKKRIVCDEAWMMVKASMPGATYTAQFLENCARRIRKRNGALLVASQNFKEFADNPQGAAVLTNTPINIFLKQNAVDLDAVQNTFKLSDGEKEFLASALKGNFLLKMAKESTTGYAHPFEQEKYLIELKSAARMAVRAQS